MHPERAERANEPCLHAQKQALRSRILAQRDALPAPEREHASREITQQLVATPSLASARVVLAWLPFRSEWDTRPLIAALLARGSTVVLPRVDRSQRMLVLHAVDDPPGQTLASPPLGIPEPREDLPRIEPESVDWVLVPGVAFDAHGRRLGYGGGFYDRLLPLMRPGTPRVAGAFDLQVVEAVPAARHDQRVHRIVTERRIVEVDAPR